jgi:hypothetical protein
MREDLKSPMIKATIEEDFSPIVLDMTSNVITNITTVSGVNSNNVLPFKLKGFYGTKVKGSADLLLTGDYNVPLYAQWKYGEGTVGSFMCDLVGDWSDELISSDEGKILIQNIVKTLTPIKNIRDNDIRLTLTEDNYYNNLSILTDLKEGEYLKGTIYYENEDGSNSISLSNFETNKEKAYTVIACDQDNNYSRSRFVLKDITTYEIEVIKYDANGNEIGSNKIYKSLPYSEEYSSINGDGTEYEEVAKQYARLGNGSYIEDLEDPHEIIDSFDINLITRFDPRILFSILIIVLFLTDFAVRKFKFRWPHEMVRDHKNKKK